MINKNAGKKKYPSKKLGKSDKMKKLKNPRTGKTKTSREKKVKKETFKFDYERSTIDESLKHDENPEKDEDSCQRFDIQTELSYNGESSLVNEDSLLNESKLCVDDVNAKHEIHRFRKNGNIVIAKYFNGVVKDVNYYLTSRSISIAVRHYHTSK